jgi:hypothetical protein
MIRRKTALKKGKGYPFWVVTDRDINENDPVLIRKKEEAIKSLTECPLPDYVFKRGKKKRGKKHSS